MDARKAEMTRAVKGQVQADGGCFAYLEKLIQVVLDQPRRTAK